MTAQQAPRRTWTEVGQPYTLASPIEDSPRLEDGRTIRRRFVVDAIAGLDWTSPRGSFPMLVASSFTEAIRQLSLPRVSAVAWSNALAPYLLLGIEAHYSNGRARVYILWHGAGATPLCSDFWPKAQEQAS